MPTKAPFSPIQRSQPKRRRRLDADARRRSQHGAAIVGALPLEQFPAGHGDHGGLDALAGQQFAGRHRESRLPSRSRAGSRRGRLRFRAAHRRRGRRGFRGAFSARRAGPDGSGPGPKAPTCRPAPPASFRRLDRVGRPEHQQVRHGAQRRQMLDRLMGRAVLAEADGIMGQHIDDPLPISADRRMAPRA